MRTIRYTVGGFCAVAALVLGACGDDDAETTTAPDTSTSIETEATEFAFSPDTWTVPSGEEFSVDFTNGGTLQHEWAVLKQGEEIESEAEFTEDKVLFEVEAIPAGESTTESFTIDESGTYQVICAIETHFDAGMEGTLTVG